MQCYSCGVKSFAAGTKQILTYWCLYICKGTLCRKITLLEHLTFKSRTKMLFVRKKELIAL